MAKSPLAAALAGIVGENAEQLGIKNWLDTGIPELNAALSGDFDGGAPGGRVIEIFGPASSGKTFLATMIMKAAQDAGGIAGFSDHERSFEPGLAASLGMDVSADSGRFIYKRPETFEDSMAVAMTFCEQVRKRKLIPDTAPLVWVFDSVASMIPHEKLYDAKNQRRKPGDYNMRDKLALAVATSQHYPGLAQFAEDYNMTVVLLNQVRMKPGVMYGDPTTTPGGQAAEFYASIRVSLGRKMITNGENGDKKETLGQEITANVIKNKVTRPFQKAKWRVMYNMTGKGAWVDVVGSTLDYVVRKGLIDRSGNYLVWEGKKIYESALAKQLLTDPLAMDKLRKLLPSDAESIGEDVTESSLPTEGGDIHEAAVEGTEE